MTTTIASAPGKLVIAGEYSVLEGFPAWVAAVDRRAIVTLDRDAPDVVDGICLTAPDRAPGLATWDDAADNASVVVDGDDAPFFDLVARTLDEVRRVKALPTSAALHIDTTSMATAHGDDGRAIKLGLGSSAAVAAAVVKVFLPDVDESALLDHAFAAHLAFSQGAGSGVDVGASCVGGHLRFERDGKTVAATALPPVRDDIAIIPVFVGRSQDTRLFLAGTRALKLVNPFEYAARIEALQSSANLLTKAARDVDADVFAAVDACRNAMNALGARADIDIVSDLHQRVAEIAQEMDGAAKPSGAGGGDVALCFVEVTREQETRAALAAAGFSPLALALGDEGARIDG